MKRRFLLTILAGLTPLVFSGAAPLSASVLGGQSAPAVVATGFTEFAIPTSFNPSIGITSGPDSNLWFTSYGGPRIGRITTAGVYSEFAIPNPNGSNQITAGSDGNLWFSGNGYSVNGEANVGRITPFGNVTEFVLPPKPGGRVPVGVTAGSDGNIWYTDLSGIVGRITPTGVITEFTLPAAGAAGSPIPYRITHGPDGNLWFSEYSGKVGRITPTGAITEFTISTASSGLVGIVSGPDGNIWFTEVDAYKIGRITPAGTVTEFPLPAGSGFLQEITLGSDGNLWFTESSPAKIGRITPFGAVTEFPVPNGLQPSDRILSTASGADGNIWFTEYDRNKIGRLSIASTDKTPPTVTCSVTPSTLWPPNGKLVPVQVTVSVTDPDGSGPNGFKLVAITSNQGNIATEQQGFVVGTSSTSGKLRAARNDDEEAGRVYTLIYQGSDVAGNTATCAVKVRVPHDRDS